MAATDPSGRVVTHHNWAHGWSDFSRAMRREAVRLLITALMIVSATAQSLAGGWSTLVLDISDVTSISLSGRPINGELPSLNLNCTGYEDYGIAPSMYLLLPPILDFSIRAGDDANVTTSIDSLPVTWNGRVEANDSTVTAIELRPEDFFALPRSLLASVGELALTVNVRGNSLESRIVIPSEGGATASGQFLDACGQAH